MTQFFTRSVTAPVREKDESPLLLFRVNNTVVILNPAAGNERAKHYGSVSNQSSAAARYDHIAFR
jgi:hypothetical protein